MKREEKPNETPRKEKMQEALAHYDEIATKACWHRSDIPEAIRAYYASPSSATAEEYLKLPQNDGKLKYCPVHFFPTLIRLMEGFAALQNKPQPTAEGAEANRHIRQLKEFHTAFNLPQRDIPTIIPPDEFKLRHKILVEEVGELSDAYFVDDIVEVADAITDCLYVLIGTALQFGIADKLEACFDEVHRSNMSKLGNDGYPIMREDGKVMKGENYTRPDLKSILSEPIVAQQQPTAEGADEILEQSFRKVLQSVALHGYDLICAENDCIKIANDFTTLHAKRIADKMVWDMRKKLFSMRATKESMDKLSEADRLMMYGYHDCINEILMWTKGIEK